MSNILAGFVKGFADTTRTGLERREEEEREIRKAKLLNELRMATEKEMTLFKESTPAAKEERDRARRNMEINEGRFSLEQDRFEVGKDQWEREFGATQDYRNRSLSLQERSLDSRGKGGKGGAGFAGGDATDFDIANELMYRYKSEVAAAAESNNISAPAIRQAAVAIVANSKTGDQAQREFLRFLDRYRTGRAKTDQAGRPKY